MQQDPPSGSAKNSRKSGKLNLEAPGRKTADRLTSSKIFSTGRHETLEGDSSKRHGLGGRIVGDVRRALLFTLVLVVVGVILAEFVKML